MQRRKKSKKKSAGPTILDMFEQVAEEKSSDDASSPNIILP